MVRPSLQHDGPPALWQLGCSHSRTSVCLFAGLGIGRESRVENRESSLLARLSWQAACLGDDGLDAGCSMLGAGPEKESTWLQLTSACLIALEEQSRKSHLGPGLSSICGCQCQSQSQCQCQYHWQCDCDCLRDVGLSVCVSAISQK